LKATNAVAKILKTEGIEFVIGFPMNPIFEGLAKEDIRFIKAKTERIAVNITDGIGRVSLGKSFGVSAMQSNQGLENAYSGIAQAWDDSMPILVLPMGLALRRINTLPSYSAVKNCAGITKWVDSVVATDQIPELMILEAQKCISTSLDEHVSKPIKSEAIIYSCIRRATKFFRDI